MMNNIILILLLILPTMSYSQDNTILCADGVCSSDILPEDQLEKSFYTKMVFEQNSSNIIVKTGAEEQQPRSLRMSLNNKSFLDAKDITVNLASKIDKYNSADVMIIADTARNVNINVDGYKGKNGLSAAELCANNIKSGKYDGTGADQRFSDKFLTRRRTSSGVLDENKCDYLDLVDLQDNAFFCDDLKFDEIEDLNSPKVDVQRLKGKTRCIGLSYNDVCLSKTLEISCEWQLRLSTGGISEYDNVIKKFTMPEREYLARRNDSSYINYLCDYATKAEEDPEQISTVKNGDFNFNLNHWDVNIADRSKYQIRMLGGLGLGSRPQISQKISTIPGREYRVIVDYEKDEYVLGDMVSTARIRINDSVGSVIENKEFYEQGSINGVYLYGLPAAHHFNYISSGTASSPKEFVIENKDDRVAQGCQAPVLAGGGSSQFKIVSDSCGTRDMIPGEKCLVKVIFKPTSYGNKDARIERVCNDRYASKTQLGVYVKGTGLPVGGNIRRTGTTWQSYIDTRGGYAPLYGGGFAYSYGSVSWRNEGERYCSSYRRINDSGSIYWTCRGYSNVSIPSSYKLNSTLYPLPLVEFPLVKNSDLDPAKKKDNYSFDFIFTARDESSEIVAEPVLRFHRAYFDNIRVSLVSEGAGVDKGLIFGQTNLPGYYERLPTTPYVYTSPSYDPIYFTIPEESDWRMRYVNVSESCPLYFDKIRYNHLASNITYTSENSCDEASIPEDPVNDVISWQDIGYDRLPEFNTETVECRLDNCPVTTSIRDLNHKIDTLNPTSGANGSQQGEGVIFAYSVSSATGSALVGTAGVVGENDLPVLETDRLCSRKQDATTEPEGLYSEFAASPTVYFRRYKWQALEVDLKGNFGEQPVDNGKRIHINQRMSPSALYLLQKEML